MPLPLKQASLGKDFPKSLERIVNRMLCKSPAERFDNLTLVARELATISNSTTGSKLAEQTQPKEKKAPAMVTMSVARLSTTILIAALLVIPVAALAGYMFSESRILKSSKNVTNQGENENSIQNKSTGGSRENQTPSGTTGVHTDSPTDPAITGGNSHVNAMEEYIRDIETVRYLEIKDKTPRGEVIKALCKSKISYVRLVDPVITTEQVQLLSNNRFIKKAYVSARLYTPQQRNELHSMSKNIVFD